MHNQNGLWQAAIAATDTTAHSCNSERCIALWILDTAHSVVVELKYVTISLSTHKICLSTLK